MFLCLLSLILLDERLVASVEQHADWSLEHMCQLHQWQLWREERAAPPLPLSWPFRERCLAAFYQADVTPSRLQRQVQSVLAELGLEVQEDVRTSQGYSLDLVVELEGERVGVEVDGRWTGPRTTCGPEVWMHVGSPAGRRCSSGGSCDAWAGGSSPCRTGSGMRCDPKSEPPT